MVQLPIASRATLAPLTLQVPEVNELKLTGSPEVAVALTLKGERVICRSARAAKAIVCGDLLMIVKLRSTFGAALYCAFPA